VHIGIDSHSAEHEGEGTATYGRNLISALFGGAGEEDFVLFAANPERSFYRALPPRGRSRTVCVGQARGITRPAWTLSRAAPREGSGTASAGPRATPRQRSVGCAPRDWRQAGLRRRGGAPSCTALGTWFGRSVDRADPGRGAGGTRGQRQRDRRSPCTGAPCRAESRRGAGQRRDGISAMIRLFASACSCNQASLRLPSTNTFAGEPPLRPYGVEQASGLGRCQPSRGPEGALGLREIPEFSR